MSRVLAVDPGDVRIGIAISDPSRTIAQPLETVAHVARRQDAEMIMERAVEYDVGRIVVGVAYDDDGEPGPQARKALRLIEVLVEICPIPVTPWDESGSTKAALRGRHPDPELDARAAAVILQDYLDAQSP